MGAIALAASCFLVLILATVGVTTGRLLAAGTALVALSAFTLSSFAFFFGLAFFSSTVVIRTFAAKSTKARLAIMMSCAVIGFTFVAIPRFVQTIAKVRARDSHAYHSLRERTKPASETSYEVNLDEKDAEKLENEDYFANFPMHSRPRAIAWLHRSAVGHFLETPDFGVLRMGYPALRDLENGDGTPIELPEIEDAYPPVQSFDRLANRRYDGILSPSNPVVGQLSSGHRTYQSWFLDANRFGDIQDLDHVAGFLPHAIVEDKSKPRDIQRPLQPKQDEFPIQLSKLQLVGLLYHAEPVVYDLETMPELLSAETAQTRPLDGFENRGLQKLLAGQFIHVEQFGPQLRMLGSLRSSQSCVPCHEGPTNQLLGAFSYVLNSGETSPSLETTQPLGNVL